MTRPAGLMVKILLALVLLPGLACDASSFSPFARTGGGTPVPTLSNVLPPEATAAAPVAARPSPAGWIAFVKEGNVWLIHPDGSGQKQITQNPPPANPAAGPGDYQLHWSPEGGLLAFSHGGRISVLEIAGLSLTQLGGDTAGGFDFSTDAKQIIYDTAISGTQPARASNSGLFIVEVESQSYRPLRASTTAHPLMLAPLWSPDGSRIIFSAPRDAEPDGTFLLSLAPPGISNLIPHEPGACAWSPTELVLACVNTDPAQGKAPGVLLFDEDGKQTKGIALPAGTHQPRLGPWSLDGKRLAIVYSSEASGASDKTGFVTLDSGDFKPIAPGRIADWSPDARWAIMEPPAGSPAGELSIVEVASGTTTPLTAGFSARWQPDAPPALVAGTGKEYCMDASAGFVHQKPKGYFLQFCVGSQHFTYGALEKGVYAMGPNARFFIYVSNSGFIYAARMGDKTLTRIGNVREFRAIWTDGIEPSFEIRFLPGYPHLVQVVERDFNQDETFTLPRRIFTP